MASAVMECKNPVKSIDELAAVIKQELDFDSDLLYETKKYFGEDSTMLLCFEKYFMRNGSYASLTVMLAEKGGVQTADIIATGGGSGILNISWGANDSFAEKAVKLLKKYGFEEKQ